MWEWRVQPSKSFNNWRQTPLISLLQFSKRTAYVRLVRSTKACGNRILMPKKNAGGYGCLFSVYWMDDTFASSGRRILVANQKPSESVPCEHLPDVVFEPATVCESKKAEHGSWLTIWWIASMQVPRRTSWSNMHIVDPSLKKKIPHFDSPPTGTQWSIEAEKRKRKWDMNISRNCNSIG
jgi:hypothetical protein